MAGYSGTPLPKKLGIREGHTVVVLGGTLPIDPPFHTSLVREADVIVLFTKARADLEARIDELRGAIRQDGALWVAWPKKASKVPTDMTEQVVRDVALPLGLVDNKVCAIDEVWSGLRLVIRRENRRL